MSDKEGQSGGVQERGMERQKDGRMIPFCHVVQSSDLHYTLYGDSEPYLIKSVFRGGKATWGVQYDAVEVDGATVSKILQGDWKNEKGRFLYRVVRETRATFDLQGEAEAIAFYRTRGAPIQSIILRAIRTGDTSGLQRLARCIKAAAKVRQKPTITKKVMDAMMRAAREARRVPRWQEVRDALHDNGDHPDDANFLRLLRSSGFGWLIG